MNALTLAILTPLVTAVLCLFSLRSLTLQRFFGVAGMAVLLGVALRLMAEVGDGTIEVVRFGNWPAPFGIVLVADLLAGIMVLVSAIIGLAVSIYSIADVDARRVRFGYYAFLHFMIFGVCGAFLTGDIFNLFVWFEVMLISSFVLMSLGGEKPQMEGAVKYVTLNLISSSFFLAACGILYGQTGTLNMADLALTRTGDASGVAHHDGDAFSGGLRAQSGDFPAIFLAPGVLSHAAGRGVGDFCRPADQGSACMPWSGSSP
jgi:Formate hydrogenlyase subunit 3/Multisubunit Na+/H+ antiporter, MnhD subunit